MASYVVQTKTISCESPKAMLFENLKAIERAIIPSTYF